MRGYLGLHGRTVPIPRHFVRIFGLNQSTGVEVLAVEPGAPAEDASIEADDVIVTLGDQTVQSVDDLHKLLTQLPVGIPASIVLLRGERRLQRFVVSREYPEM